MKRAQVLDILKEEIGNLLEGVEDSSDEEDVDADAGEGSIAPEAVGDERGAIEALLTADPKDKGGDKNNGDGKGGNGGG